MKSASPWVHAAAAVFVVASCGGVQERLDLLRAHRIEIVDDNDNVKMDLEKQIRLLEDRVQKLEGARLREPALVVPAEPPPAAVTASASAPDPAKPAPLVVPLPPRSPRPKPALPSRTSAPDVF